MKTNIKLIGLSVAAVIALTACSKKDEQSAATQPEPAATTAAPADAAPAAMEQVAINITGAGASFPQPIYANGQLMSNKLPAVKGTINQSVHKVHSSKSSLKLLTSVLQMRH